MPIGKIVNAVGGLFGLGGGQGESFQAQTQNEALKRMANRQKIYDNPNVPLAFREYGLGQSSVLDALNKPGLSGEQLDEFQTQFAIDPMSGSRFATEQVQTNPILGSLFGKGGSLERATGEEADLAKRGYSLQPEDYEAYGQASGDIARMFGAQESSLAQSLARRGLGSSASGSALSGYAGLQGNKAEQLAGIQRQIADQRMNMNLQRLNQTRNYLTNMGGLGAEAINQQYNRQLAGAGAKRQSLLGMSQQQNQSNQIANQANLAAMQDKRSAEKSSLMDAVGGGILGGVTSGISSGISGAFSGSPSSGKTEQPKAGTTKK